MIVLQIHRIECIAHASGVDQDVLVAAAGAIADAAAAAAAAAPVAGPVGVVAGAVTGAAVNLIRGIPNLAAAIDNATDDPDQLYLSLYNVGDRDLALWPLNNPHYYEIRSGQAVNLNISLEVGPDVLDINFWEWDVGPDDFLGKFSVDQGQVADGVRSQIVHRDAGGNFAVYAVAYSVRHVAHVQDQWRWCHKCEGLHFGYHGPKPCPAGGTHVTDQSGNYQLSLGDPQHPGQVWHWCFKCAGLHFTEHGLKPCPAGGVHEITGSGDYRLNTLEVNPQAAGQPDWNWCHKCGGLHFMGAQPQPDFGVCPADGGAHSSDGTGNYVLPII